MALIVIGLALVALGVYDYRRQRVPGDAVELPGTVTRVASTRSALTGRRKKVVYAPVVSYTHPATGRAEELEPDAYGTKQHEVGEEVRLAYSPTTGKVMRVPERRWNGLAALTLIGGGLIVLQVIDWVG